VEGDGQTLLKAKTPGEIFDYTSVPAGTYRVDAKVGVHGESDKQIPPLKYAFLPNHLYTVVAYGNVESSPKAQIEAFEDLPTPPVPATIARVQVINVYPQDVKLDIAFNNIVVFHSLDFGTRCTFFDIPAGDYVGKALDSNSYSDPVAGPDALHFDGGKCYVLLVIGPNAPHQPGLILMPNKQ
jgi:hypothetical protein